MNKSTVAIVITSLLLFTVTAGPYLGISMSVIFFAFSISPLFLVWMVYSVLKRDNYTGRELGKDEEWGYLDVKKEDL